ncbi:tyrosine-tRNA ligase [Trichophaea hybrida]|nr:tyrosine-tRNA ligase [Trichophaea hybrida]KAF8542521.1 tyrosine-tRNA ligase [Trichophaea hybrida]
MIRTLRRPKAIRWGSVVTPANAGPYSLVKELKERGLAESITGPEGQLGSFVDSQKVVVYAGIDPTANSLHVGHLLPLMNLLHFYLHGHHSIGLIGKATASVGDPSGRNTERDSIESERLRNSFESLWAQVGRFFESGRVYAISRGYDDAKFGTRELVTNGEWLDKIRMVEFLSTIGKHVRVGQMLARESVKARMESAQGINYAEFTYQLLQSYDFWHLHQSKGCRLQIGGNDQYGNITAGIDLISRLRKSKGEESPDEFELAYGLTVPLLTTASGAKFGKSASNAVWLDEKLTTPFELYQYFVKLPDKVVEKHLKIFTLLSPSEVDVAVEEHFKASESRSAQHLLAKEVVTLIHGETKASRAFIQTQLLFGPSSDSMKFSAQEIIDAFDGDGRLVEMPKAELVGEMVSKIMRRVGAVKTRSEADNILRGGGMYYGQEGKKIYDLKASIQEDWLLDGSILLLRVGKGKFVIVHAV